MQGKVRIIGGHLRGRNLKVVDHEGLRPTADRVRETLFNWLGQSLEGKVCFDMFSGSGSLGFEALSRGAKTVYMHEIAVPVLTALKNNYAQFEGDPILGRCDISRISGVSFAKGLPDQSIDICFIDPPFSARHLFEEALNEALRIVNKEFGSAIYIEHPKDLHIDLLLNEFSNFLPCWEIGRTIRSGMATGTLIVPKNR